MQAQFLVIQLGQGLPGTDPLAGPGDDGLHGRLDVADVRIPGLAQGSRDADVHAVDVGEPGYDNTITKDDDDSFVRWSLRQVPEVQGGFMAMDVNNGRVIAMQGGLAASADGQILAELALPIAGLMSLSSMEEVAAQVEDLKKAVQGSGLAKGIDPILTLAFLSLPVIPALKLTESGLFDGEAFTFCPIEVTG